MTRAEAMERVGQLQAACPLGKDNKDNNGYYARKKAFTTAIGYPEYWDTCANHAAGAIDRGMSPDHVVALAMLAFTE